MISILSASDIDRTLKLRKGTATAAFRSGMLRGIKRKGRGGWHVYALEEDVVANWKSLADPPIPPTHTHL
jgi:hypothetical protein